jgi:hypothetical protein
LREAATACRYRCATATQRSVRSVPTALHIQSGECRVWLAIVRVG